MGIGPNPAGDSWQVPALRTRKWPNESCSARNRLARVDFKRQAHSPADNIKAAAIHTVDACFNYIMTKELVLSHIDDEKNLARLLVVELSPQPWRSVSWIGTQWRRAHQYCQH